MEESEDDLDEWREIVSVMSPKGLYTGFAPEHCVTKSIVDVFSCGEGSFAGNDEKAVLNADRKLENCGPYLNSSIAGVDPDVIRMGGSIAERRAAKFGFTFEAAKIHTPRFRSSGLSSSPSAQSPYLIVASGISPGSLLDSPILLPNSQSSPTTGTLTSPTLDGDIQMLVSTSSSDGGNDFYGGSSSMFESNTDRTCQVCLPAVEKQSLMPQNLTSVHPSVDFQFPVQFPEEASVDNYDAGSPPDRKFSNGCGINDNSYSNTVPSIQMQDKNKPSLEEDSGTNNSLNGDHHKGTYATMGTLRTAEDGYNWRKYGQKQVKGSEYPRSYYKCTHPSCLVKKKVERSHDGHITEIIYKGAHNHSKPQPCRKSTFGTSDVGDGSGSCGNSSVWGNIRPDVKIGSEWRTDGMETSVVTQVSDPMSTFQGTPELSSTMASHEDDEEDATTQGSFSLGDDDNNENDSKRRKKESCFVETTLGSRAIREPRVVIQIESEIDILDDGYRWRKYGQKVVKGNPNPRSYYKCTSAGCTVRKHVERASHDMKFVITTYEGKHNHEVPAARNSTHANSPAVAAAATNTRSALTLPRNPNLPKPEPHVQDFPPHFGRPNFLGNSPFYPMNFPVFPNVRPYGSFGLSNHHHHTGYPGGMLPVIPDISTIPLPPGFPHSSNLAISSVRPLFTGHQPEDNHAKQLLRPKLEQRDESFYDSRMQNIDPANSSSSGYNHHIVPTFPS